MDWWGKFHHNGDSYQLIPPFFANIHSFTQFDDTELEIEEEVRSRTGETNVYKNFLLDF